METILEWRQKLAQTAVQLFQSAVAHKLQVCIVTHGTDVLDLEKGIIGGRPLITNVLKPYLPDACFDLVVLSGNPDDETSACSGVPGKTWHLQQAMARFGVEDRSEILLVDDCPKNIGLAQQQGYHVLHAKQHVGLLPSDLAE